MFILFNYFYFTVFSGVNPLLVFKIFCLVAFHFLLLWVGSHSSGENISCGVILTAGCLSRSVWGVKLNLIIDIKE